MGNDKQKSVQMGDMDYKRNGDKQISVNLIFSVASFIVLLVFSYVIVTISSRITRIETKTDKIEEKQDQQMNTIFTFSQQCKDEINDIRQESYKNNKESADKIEFIKDQVLAMLNKISKK